MKKITFYLGGCAMLTGAGVGVWAGIGRHSFWLELLLSVVCITTGFAMCAFGSRGFIA